MVSIFVLFVEKKCRKKKEQNKTKIKSNEEFETNSSFNTSYCYMYDSSQNNNIQRIGRQLRGLSQSETQYLRRF